MTTHGSDAICDCPWCGRANHYVTGDYLISRGLEIVFCDPCGHCTRPIEYTAHRQPDGLIRVAARRAD